MQGVSAGLSVGVSIPHNQVIAVPWDRDYFVSGGSRDPSYPTRLIASPDPDGGRSHFIDARLLWQHSTGGSQRIAILRKNGTEILAVRAMAPPPSVGQSIDPMRVGIRGGARLLPGDYMELLVFQDSGAALNLVPHPTEHPTDFTLLSLR